MAGRSRSGRMFLRRKSGKAMSERPSYPETGCGLSIEVWSMRSLLDSETRGEREEGSGGHRIQNGPPCIVQAQV